MKKIDMVVNLLLLVGALNWGLVGLFNIDLVALLFGEMSIISRVVYIVVGLAALYEILSIKQIVSRWHLDWHKPAGI